MPTAPEEALPEQSIVLELPVRTVVDWQLDQTKKAQLAADSGDLQLAADLCEALMQEDGRIRGPLAQRTSVLRLDPIVELGLGPKAAAALKQIDPKEGGLHDDIFSSDEFEKIHRWGLVLGACPYRLNWWEDGKARMRDGVNAPAIEFWHPRNLRFEWSLREWKLAVEGTQELTVTPDGPEWGIYLPYGPRRPWAEGLWRALKLYWICGLLTFEDWNRGNEKLGIGAFVAKPPADTKAADPVLKKVARELKALGREKAFALPAGWILELLESKGLTGQSFEKLIALCDTCKAITILGQNLSTEVQGGSYAATTAHKAVAADIIARDERVLRCGKSKILRQWARVVHGDPEAAPVVNLDITPPEDDAARVASWDKLGDASRKLIDCGYDCDLDKMALVVKLPQKGPAKAKPAPGAAPALATSALTKTPKALALSVDKQETALQRGHDYLDRLDNECTAHAAKELAPMVAAVVSAIAEATDYDDAKTRIIAAYGEELPPGKLLKLTEAALIMAQLAGRETVEQELATEE
jgi:phage gp29-like protein